MRERSVRSSGASGSSCACPGARAKPMARPEASAITQALSRNRRATGRAPRVRRALLRIPPFRRTCGLVVCSDAGAVEERHPSLDPATLLRQLQPPLPGAQPRPATEGLRGHPPRAQPSRDLASRDLAPLRTAIVPPDDRLDA